jgi:hypothetical protein
LEENLLNPVEIMLDMCRNNPDNNIDMINNEFSEQLIQKCLREGVIFMKDSNTYRVV